MRNLSAAIVEVLRGAPAPLRIFEIAAALRVAHCEELRVVVGDLVRARQVIRHHSPEGLSYSLSEAEASKPATPKKTRAARDRDAEVWCILDYIERHGGAVRVEALNIALRAAVPKWRVRDRLYEMVKDGALLRAGARRLAQVWLPRSEPLPPLGPVQVSAIDGRNLNGARNPKPLPGASRGAPACDAVLAALYANLHAARAALDAYVAHSSESIP